MPLLTGLAYLREFLDLESVGTGQWVATCPMPDHDDREPSLNITLRPNSDGLWRLWFHCPPCGANGDDVCAAAGMVRGRALIPSAEDIDNVQRPKRSRPLPSPAVVFYQWPEQLADEPLLRLLSWRGLPDDEAVRRHQIGWDGENYTLPVVADGRLINVLRADPAAPCKQRRPKLWPGTHHSLYPNVHARKWAIITEGIWDALMGRAYGLPTVTGTGGAGTWKDEWSWELEGHEVFVLYDCDKAGRDGAAKVKAAIPHAVVLDLAQRRHDGYDLSDHLSKYRSTDRLMEMITAGRRK